MIAALSRFVVSKTSGIIALIAVPVILAGAWYVVDAIGDRAVLERKLSAEQARVGVLENQLRAERDITRRANTIRDQEVNNAPDHKGCDNPVILRRVIERLHSDQ